MPETLPYDGKTPNRAISINERGGMTYASASATGHVEIELPALPGGPNQTERLHARDFGAFVAGKIESAMTRQPYLRSGPQQKPSEVFRHYLGCAKGAELMDSRSLKNMEKLAAEFAAESEQAEFYKQVISPWLYGLRPGKR